MRTVSAPSFQEAGGPRSSPRRSAQHGKRQSDASIRGAQSEPDQRQFERLCARELARGQQAAANAAIGLP